MESRYHLLTATPAELQQLSRPFRTSLSAQRFSLPSCTSLTAPSTVHLDYILQKILGHWTEFKHRYSPVEVHHGPVPSYLRGRVAGIIDLAISDE